MAKLNDIRALAEYTAKDVSGSPQDWMGYLDTASRLYRYSFSDNLLIHAQRPDAAACASLELWNQKMNRWVNRGAKGIALIDDTGPRLRLRYVFDITDTHMVRGGRTPNLWQIQEQQREDVLDHLLDTYGLEGEDTADLQSALLAVASQMADENLEEAMEGMAYELEGTFLEELNEDAVRVEFRNLLMNSAFYTLSRRCGLDPMEYLEEEDFTGITDFNTLSVLTFLGNATGQLVEPVLRDIGQTMRRIYLEESAKVVANGNDIGYNKFNTLIRESDNLQGGVEHGTDIPSQRGLPVPEPGDRGDGDDNRQVWDATPDIPEGTQEELVSEHDAEWETGEASDGDREGSRGEDGSPDGRTAGEISGTGQGDGADGLGSTYERSDGNGGREHLDGIGVQLSEETAEQDLSEAEEAEASALSLPELPTAEQQIRAIEEQMQALYAGEIDIPSGVVDEVLRSGGNRNGSQLRIIYNFMIDQTPEEYTEFVQKEYGKGGIGLVINGKEYSVWYDELGMQIAVGHTVTDQILDKAFLSWEEVSGRIHQLLSQGEYAPQVVLDAARDNALSEHAQALAYMEGDMAEGVAELVFDNLEPFRGGYPDKVEKIKELLAQPSYLKELNERLEGLAEAYSEDKSIMRFQFYRPDRMLAQFQKFAKEAFPYQSREGFAWEEHPVFITQDEIDTFLQGGGAYSDGRLSTYAFFIQDKTDKEKADFIKSQYGIGGRTHALSGADNSYADYDGKGLKLARGSIGNPDAEVLLKWPKAAKRVEYLIRNDNYLKAADFSRMPAYERERMASHVVNFYYHLPENIAPPWGENVDMLGWQKDVVRLLESPEETENLLKQMDEAIAELPLDYEDYEGKVQLLTNLHQYVEGTYTIFPEQKKEVELPAAGGQQLSLFDFMDITTPETAKENQDVETGEKKAPEKNLPEGKEPKANGPEIPSLTEVMKPDDVQEMDAIAEEQIEERVSEAMEKAHTSFDQFSPEQMDVIYETAQKEVDLVPMLNPEFSPEQMQLIADVMVRVAADKEAMFGHELDPLINHVMSREEINDVRKNRQFALEPLEEDVQEPQEQQTVGQDKEPQKRLGTGSTKPERINFHITDDDLGAGGPKQKFRANMEAVRLLHELEFENRMATPKEQEVLSRYVGWGGLPQAFEERNENWSNEFIELYAELSPEEYQAARASTLNAFYTSPTVIKAMYEALGNMGLQSGNVLEPSCGIGNFMGLVPPDMEQIKMYGVELDSISGRIAKQLYQKNEIAVQGFEKTEYPDSFFDCVIGNVPFGAYKVADRKYDRHNFMIHDYFIAKSLDLVRPGGMVAVVTSSGTMDKQNPSVRQYIANRADLLGAIRAKQCVPEKCQYRRGSGHPVFPEA